uniref:Xylose isomerase-like TIM barrel domain-containing protein n=1 Tax=mine drainage metagenome TaxID=410659 RepID=E6Q7B5_9ZZZZ
MKIAWASSAFAAAFARGDCTQLEWLDACARSALCDGVAFDRAHFPRTDADYLAQIKKATVDLCVTPVATLDDGFFLASRSEKEESLRIALAVGAPLLLARAPGLAACTYPELAAALGEATGLAKAANVTIALRNAPDTHASSDADCKRLAKEADSAWLRFAPEPLRLDAGSSLASLAGKIVVVMHDLAEDAERALASIEREAPGYHGFVLLDSRAGERSLGEIDRVTASSVFRAR